MLTKPKFKITPTPVQLIEQSFGIVALETVIVAVLAGATYSR